MKEALRYHLRNITLNLLGTLSRPKPGIHIINSHFTSASSPNYEVYCEFLKFLKKYCDFLPLENSVEIIYKRNLISDCIVSFTYDDGFEECYSIIAPALEEFNTWGAFFINGGFTDADNETQDYFAKNILKATGKKSMNWYEIKNLAVRGHIIGSHTLDHVNMNSTDLDLIDRQLIVNKSLIEKHTLRPCNYFAIPFGQFHHINDETLSLAEKYHKYIFSGTNYKHYYSFNGRVINRRHIECFWPKTHIQYFLSVKKKY